MIDFKYRPDVDGLRAVAVVLVLLFHADFGFTGGFVGVDVFFVISGFLITGLLLKELQIEDFRLRVFWLRRIRRILPASMVVVAVTLIASFFLLLPDDYRQASMSAAAQQLMISNFYFCRNADYFAGNANLKPLLHTWSLAVEEQFYLGYPFLLLFLRRFRPRAVLATLLVLALASFGANLCYVRSHPAGTFYLLPTRAWELLLGGTLCLVPTSFLSRRWLAESLSCLGVAGILIGSWRLDSHTPFPGAASLLPCVGTALLIFANSERTTWVGRALATRPVVYVGLISYSLYLWHWPLLCFLRHLSCGAEPDILSRVLALAASFVLAALSLRFIESPFRQKRILPGTKGLLTATIGTASLLVACSLAIVIFHGLPGRFDLKAVTYAAAKNSFSSLHNIPTKQVQDGELPAFGQPEGAHKCLIWGDSHAMALVPGLDAACKTHGILGLQATHANTAPLLDFVDIHQFGLNERSPEFNRTVMDFAISRKVNVVILAGIWREYADKPDFEKCLMHTVDELRRAGIVVVIVRDVAAQRGDVPLMLSMAVRLHKDVEKVGVPIEEHLMLNDLADSIIDRCKGSNVVVLDPTPFFVDDAKLWRAEYDGEAMYWDVNHLSIKGSLRLKPMFEHLFDVLGLK